MSILVNILHILFTLTIIIIVLLQSGKTAGLSGAIAGGAETFFGKNKGRTIDAILSRITAFAALAFLATSTLLQLINIKSPYLGISFIVIVICFIVALIIWFAFSRK